MGLFRRAKGVCPVCGKKKQADVGQKHQKAKKWTLTCSACGTKFTVKVDSVWWIFFRAADRAGFKGLRLHDARHSLASWLVMGGESLYTVATILGHRNLDMTQRYSHLVSDKSTGISPSKVIEKNIAETMQDGPSAGGDVGALLREGFGLQGTGAVAPNPSNVSTPNAIAIQYITPCSNDKIL